MDKSENAFSGMNSKWDEYLFGINQMIIVGNDDYRTFTATMLLFKIYCHVVNADFAGQNPMLQFKNL